MITVRQVDTHRYDLYVGDQRIAYAICDAFGWAVMHGVDGRIRTVQRVDYGTTARRNARVGTRLVELVAALDRPGTERPSPSPRRNCANFHELQRVAAVLDLPVSYFTERAAVPR